MSKILVTCPNCNKNVVAHGAVSFYHCGTAFLIKDCINRSISDKVAANSTGNEGVGKLPKNEGSESHAGQDNTELRREGAQELGESANPDNSEPVSGRADSPSEGSTETGAETEQLSIKKPSEGDHA